MSDNSPDYEALADEWDHPGAPFELPGEVIAALRAAAAQALELSNAKEVIANFSARIVVAESANRALQAEVEIAKTLNVQNEEYKEMLRNECSRLKAEVDRLNSAVEHKLETIYQSNSRAADLQRELLAAMLLNQAYEKELGIGINTSSEETP